MVETLTKADDTLDSRVSSTMDLVTVIPSYLHMHQHEPDHTYSSIPEDVFTTPLSGRLLPAVTRSPSTWSQASSFSPNLQRCASTPNPTSKRQRYEETLDKSQGYTSRAETINPFPFNNNFVQIQNSYSLPRTMVSANNVGLPTSKNSECMQEAPGYVTLNRKEVEAKESLLRSDFDADYRNTLLSGFIPSTEDLKHDKRHLLEFAVTHGLHQLRMCCEEVYVNSLNAQNSLESLLVFDNLLPSSVTKRKIVLFIRFSLRL